jgi:hypothetical protein
MVAADDALSRAEFHARRFALTMIGIASNADLGCSPSVLTEALMPWNQGTAKMLSTHPRRLEDG